MDETYVQFKLPKAQNKRYGNILLYACHLCREWPTIMEIFVQ